ncbi:META domain-containing protein [Sphingomonas sp. 1P08PE]|uniref:META domain-containing protein n=1 Tax=Sphingomonas sp. 1P08PE TaxID=554122 RepID=UPI00399F76DD
MIDAVARHLRCWLLPVMCGVLLGGCPAEVFRGGEPGRDPLTQRSWVLRRLQDRVVPRHEPEAAIFEFVVDHSVAGEIHCNSISSHAITWYEDMPRRQGHFAHDRTKPTIMTAAGCLDDATGARGATFWTLMETAQRWWMTDRTLTIQFADGSVARLADAGNVWDRRQPECPAAAATAGTDDDPVRRNLDCRRR